MIETVEEMENRLKEGLAGADLEDPSISVIAAEGHRRKYFGMIVSKSFERMDEGERQRLVWDHVIRNLEPEIRDRLDFLFTDAPSELELEAAEGAPAP